MALTAPLRKRFGRWIFSNTVLNQISVPKTYLNQLFESSNTVYSDEALVIKPQLHAIFLLLTGTTKQSREGLASLALTLNEWH